MSAPSEQVIEAFVERLGMVAQGDGLPRISGRIMGLLVIYQGPFSSSELAERLRVSRGSISTNSRLLEGLGVIERVTRPGERQDYFQLRTEPYVEMLKGYLSRLHKAREAVADARLHLEGHAWSGARDRLSDLGAFYEGLIDMLDAMIREGRGDGSADPGRSH